MLIGVDARPLCNQLSGIGRYTFEILSRMIASDHSWIFYAHKPIEIGNWDYPNIKVKSHNFSHNISRMVWAQTALPLMANSDCLDIFWSPAHRLPTLLNNNIAKVVTIHDLVWKHSGETMRPVSRFLDSIFMPIAVSAADKVIVVSNHTARDLIAEVDSAKSKISTIHLGYSSLFSQSSNLYSLPSQLSGVEFILFVGTLEPRKNLHRILEAFSRISDSDLGLVKLVIVGGKGWGGVDVGKLASEYNIEDKVIVLGYVDDQVLKLLYRSALFLLMPSLYEGFGLPLVEALSVGTPVVTSNCSSMPEVVGDAAILVDPYSVDSIKTGIQTMLSNPTLRVKLSEIGLKQSALFSWDKAADLTLKIFQEAVLTKRFKNQL